MSRSPLAVLLLIACAPPPAAPVDPRPSWYRDALPIVQSRCAGCHVEGGIAPFALATYADADAHRGAIAADVQARKMPPWMPSSSCQPYKDSRRLSDDEIATLVGWANDGIEGNLADAPVATKRQALPWVDQTLDQGFDYTPVAGRIDDYHCFILDPKLVANRDLVGFDIQPGVRREVHHVLLYSVPMADAVALDNQTAGPGWECFGGPGFSSPKTIGGWAPGTPVTRFPPNTGVTVYQGDAVVMQVHYNMANGPAAPDRTLVNFMYSKVDVPLHALMLPLADKSFTLQPNAVGYTHGDTFDVPFDATIWGLLPHMHVKGESVKVRVTAPTGEDTCLVDVPKWDFHWQQFYFFDLKEGVPIKANSTLKIDCTWSNPTADSVRWGEGTNDEMCLAFFYVTSGTP